MRSTHWKVVLAACLGLGAVLVLWWGLGESRSAGSSQPDTVAIGPEGGEGDSSEGARDLKAEVLVHSEAPRDTTPDGRGTLPRRVFGRVIDPDGQPVSGVEVLAAEPVHVSGFDSVLAFGVRRNDPGFTPARPARTTSDREGTFALEIPNSETVQLALHHDGFADQHRVVRVPGLPWEGKALSVGDLEIDYGVALPIRVEDESGRAVPDAVVLRRGLSEVADGFELDWNELVLASGSADGVFRLESLARGRTELEVRAPGFVPARREVLADRPVLEEWRVILSASAPIAGRVLDAPDGEILEVGFFEPLTRETRRVRCRPDGCFTIDGLAPEGPEVRLFATRVIRASHGSEPYARESLTPSVPARPGDRDVLLQVPAPCLLRLTVEDSETGTPLPDARFGLWESADSPHHEVAVVASRSEGPGAYLLSRLFTRARKSRAIAVSHPGYESVAVGALPFVPGEIRELGVVRLRPVRPTMLRVTDVRGSAVGGLEILVDADVGTSGTSAFVAGWPERTTLEVESRTVTTAADGTASVCLTSHQTYSLWGETEEGAVRRSLVVEDAPPRELDLRLEPFSTASVLCLDARTREPLVDEPIVHEFLEAPGLTLSPSGTTNEEGRADFEGLLPGQHRFWPELAPDTSARTVSLTAGVSTEVTLLRLTTLAFHGRITERGRPVPGARVEVRDRSATTDREGLWGLDVKQPGEAELRILPPGGSPRLETVVLVLPETRFDVDLSPRTVRGLVRDANGPLAGATVRLAQRQPGGGYGGTGHQTTSGSAGDFRLGPFLPRAELTLQAECPGYQLERQGPLEPFEDGSERVHVLRLTPAAVLEVTVEEDPPSLLHRRVLARWNGARGREPDDLESLAEDMAGEERSGSRLFRFDHLSPGPWRIELRDPYLDWPLDQIAVELTVGENAPLRMRP